MKFKSAVMMGVLSAVSLVAVAQWQWVEADGRKVFSDRAPPPGTPEKNILKQPGGKPTAMQPAATAANSPASSAGAASVLRPPARDKDLEDKKKQAEQADSARKKAEEEKYLKAKADSCSRARLAKASFDSGVRITRMNEKGEHEYLDDAARAAEANRIQGVIQSDCN